MKLRKEKDEFRAYFEESIPKEKKDPKQIILYSAGIFLIFVAFICLYLFILNFDYFLSLLPVTKDENGKIVLKKPDDDNKTSEDRSKLIQPMKSEIPKTMSGTSGIKYYVKEVIVDDKGMYITIEINKTNDRPFEVECDQILVDGFPVKDKFSFASDEVETIEKTITILKTELDPVEIYQPQQIKLYMKQYDVKHDDRTEYLVVVNNSYSVGQRNIKRETILVDDIGETKIHFFKKVSDADYTYIYFFFQNNSDYKRTVKVKKLVINGKIYDYRDLNVELYRSAKTVDYIRIPKKEYKEIDNYSVSFFVIGPQKDSTGDGIFITNEFESKS